MAEVRMKSVKHSIIEKTNSFIVMMVGIAVFVVVFCIFASKALISQSAYQQRVINEKQLALDTLNANKVAIDELKVQYAAFASASVNVLTGNPAGSGPIDGENPKIVLDALPSVYDYPGLSSSVEKILIDGGFGIESIGGAEDPLLAGQPTTSAATADVATATKPVPIAIPYPISVKTSVVGAKQLFETLEKSIRPFKVDAVSITSADDGLLTSITMNTYFLPETGLNVTTKVVD